MDDEKKELLLEVIRLSYLAGINDKEEDCEQWCNQGSRERAEDLFREYVSDEIIKEDAING